MSLPLRGDWRSLPDDDWMVIQRKFVHRPSDRHSKKQVTCSISQSAVVCDGADSTFLGPAWSKIEPIVTEYLETWRNDPETLDLVEMVAQVQSDSNEYLCEYLGNRFLKKFNDILVELPSESINTIQQRIRQTCMRSVDEV